MRARFVAVVAVVLAAALAPVSAGAAGGSVTVSMATSLKLSAKILVTVPVTVVCSDVPGLTPIDDGVTVTIEQAHSSTISHGSGGIGGGFGSPLLLTCDGTTVNSVSVNVLADTSGSPFKTGAAIATASASRTDGTSCGPGCFTNFQLNNGSTGPMAVKLRG